VRSHGRGLVLLPVRLNQRAARALRRHPRTLLVKVTVATRTATGSCRPSA